MNRELVRTTLPEDGITDIVALRLLSVATAALASGFQTVYAGSGAGGDDG
jgi:hypothetical protein